jgi:hypothetical protein
MESRQQHNRPGVVETLVAVAGTLAVMGLQMWVLWLQISPQERMWIRLAVAGRVRSSAAAMAWNMGHRGMAEEIRTGQRSIRYLAAWGLSTVRDQAQQALETMRP